MIVIIDKIGSNISSIQFALNRLGQESIVTMDKNIIQSSSHIILPGVGHAEHAMQILNQYQLIALIQQLTQPVLGICLGMQILFEASTESQNDEIKCLNLLPGKIKNLVPQDNLSIPHMGWNQIYKIGNIDSPILRNISENSYVYFIHSYIAPVGLFTVAETFYGEKFSAVVRYKNFYGMQFHPEKSGKIGEQLLKNFLSLSGEKK